MPASSGRISGWIIASEGQGQNGGRISLHVCDGDPIHAGKERGIRVEHHSSVHTFCSLMLPTNERAHMREASLSPLGRRKQEVWYREETGKITLSRC